MGGALRFRQELDGYLSRRVARIKRIGGGRQVSGLWLVQREFRAGACSHSVAINNVSFAWAGQFKTVLLRNALHFLSDEERSLVDISGVQRAQTVVVHQMLRRADRIVVPTASMASRVKAAKPNLAGRILVMPHPVTTPRPCSDREDVVLCPVLNSPYKKLGQRLTEVVSAMTEIRAKDSFGSLELLLTLTAPEAATLQLRLPHWVHLLGRLSTSELATVRKSARAIIYPTTLESFGYPLAEARLSRQPVISPNTDHAQEVAGDALVGYDPNDTGSLVSALQRALELRLSALSSNPFDPDQYFDRLFEAG